MEPLTLTAAAVLAKIKAGAATYHNWKTMEGLLIDGKRTDPEWEYGTGEGERRDLR